MGAQDACAVGGKTGVVRGFRSIGKNCACAGGKNVARGNVLFGA